MEILFAALDITINLQLAHHKYMDELEEKYTFV